MTYHEFLIQRIVHLHESIAKDLATAEVLTSKVIAYLESEIATTKQSLPAACGACVFSTIRNIFRKQSKKPPIQAVTSIDSPETSKPSTTSKGN